MWWIGTLALGIALFLAIAGAATPESCPAPAGLHDGRQTPAPVTEGLDPICAIGAHLERVTEADPNGSSFGKRRSSTSVISLIGIMSAWGAARLGAARLGAARPAHRASSGIGHKEHCRDSYLYRL
jgi:hypothetical protein